MNPDLNQTVEEISFFVPNDSGRFLITKIRILQDSSQIFRRNKTIQNENQLKQLN